MKIIVIGASGTIGKIVSKRLEKAGHEVIRVGRKSGDYQANIEDRASVAALYRKLGSFDAVVNAAGDVAFAPFEKLGGSEWELSLGSKFLQSIGLAPIKSSSMQS
jgi:nucleoside-diphosphate-sugar epimerase